MGKWHTDQETSGICEGLIAELVEQTKHVSDNIKVEHCQSSVQGVLSVSKWECLCSVAVWRPITLNFDSHCEETEALNDLFCSCFMCLVKSHCLGKRCCAITSFSLHNLDTALGWYAEWEILFSLDCCERALSH